MVDGLWSVARVLPLGSSTELMPREPIRGLLAPTERSHARRTK